jgi:hypothetical protein
MGGLSSLARLSAAMLAVSASPALATDLPPNVQDMLREAYPKERQTVVNVLKRLYPDSTAEIDAIVKQVDERRKAQVESMGFVEGLRGEVAAGGYVSTGNTQEWGVSGTAAIRRQGRTWSHSHPIFSAATSPAHPGSPSAAFATNATSSPAFRGGSVSSSAADTSS